MLEAAGLVLCTGPTAFFDVKSPDSLKNRTRAFRTPMGRLCIDKVRHNFHGRHLVD